MKYFLDSEFYEKPNTISLISLAIVAEDGREFYKWNKDYDKEAEKDEWLLKNVFSFKPPVNCDLWISQKEFKYEIDDFIGNDTNPEFWGYYCDYDWVIFCWQFGRMIELPDTYPMYCHDLKQLIDRLKNPDVPEQCGTEHDALADARWIRNIYNLLESFK